MVKSKQAVIIVTAIFIVKKFGKISRTKALINMFNITAQLYNV